MDTLYNLPIYKAHLEHRNNKQGIMLGFSDGTKDGGYLKANWEIFNTKEILSQVSDENGMKVVFFDGRGGPPARGGGKTHRFYASQGKNIANHETQLTIQGQTITSMYGTVDQFMHNCEQLITAGITNEIFDDEKTKISAIQRELIQTLAEAAYEKYQSLKQHEKFVPYLEKMSTLKYYGKANIGSRPAKRGKAKKLILKDLRAISFVGSWSQLKQNVPGYFGIGTAIAQLKAEGKINEVKDLFQNVAFFKSLILNSMMSMTKSNFALTKYMKDNEAFGEFWQILKDEYELSKAMMLEISGFSTLMETEPVSKASIAIREQIVLPLLTIQQYALQRVAQGNEYQEVYEKMIMRSLFGNVNASRNSA
jgi:phosphoenolpyruvate carboxylase